MSSNANTAYAPVSGLRALTVSSLALALSSASLLAFRGPTSIVSALIVPSLLESFLGRVGRGYRLAAYACLLAISVLFFQTQVIFAFGYILLGLAFRAVLSNPCAKSGYRGLRFALAVALSALVLFICLILTETLLGVPLHAMMMRISRQNPAIYAGIIVFEATLVCLINIMVIRVVSSRLRM